MDEAPAPDASERLHWSSLLSSVTGSLRNMWGLVAGGAYLAVQGQWMLVVFGGILFTAISVGAATVRWLRFAYTVAEDQIRIDSGIVSRTHRTIPFDRIQDVDITQGPLARLLGVARVKFETGGGSGGTDEGVLDAVPLGRAEDIRKLIRARRSGTAQRIDPAIPVESGDPVYAMDARRLLVAGLFNFSLALFAGLFGLTQTMGDLVGFDPFNRRFWASLLSADSQIAAFLLALRIAAVAGGLLVLILVGLATGVVRTALRDFGFRVDRTDAGLRRRRGMLTRTDVTVPIARVQAAILSTGPMRDHWGWRELTFQNLAQDEGGKGNHIIAPLAHDAELDRILAELGWRRVSPDLPWKAVSISYVWAGMLWMAPIIPFILLQAMFVPWVGLVGGTLVMTAVAVRYLAWRRTRYALDGDRLLVRSGWWRRRLIILPVSKIQSLDVTQDPVDRCFGIADLQLGVAGGGMFPRHEVPALAPETARQLRTKLLSTNP